MQIAGIMKNICTGHVIAHHRANSYLLSPAEQSGRLECKWSETFKFPPLTHMYIYVPFSAQLCH